MARHIRTLTQWLRHDVLILAGPALATRQALFAFLVEELALHAPGDLRRIRPVRVALQNQRNDLLAFVGKLAAIAQTYNVAKSPRELMTGQSHPHWLTLLGLGPLQPQRA